MERNNSDVRVWRFVAFMLGGCALGLSFARALRPELGTTTDVTDAEIVARIYSDLALAGGICAMAAVGALVGLVVALRERPRAQALSAVALMLFASGVVAWLGHAPTAWAIVDTLGLATLVASVLDETPADQPVHARQRQLTHPRWRVQPAWSERRP